MLRWQAYQVYGFMIIYRCHDNNDGFVLPSFTDTQCKSSIAPIRHLNINEGSTPITSVTRRSVTGPRWLSKRRASQSEVYY